jgi:N-formylglutamate deformylase
VTPSDYTRRGMGLIRREALPGVPMYDRALSVAEVEQRLVRCYRPYRAAVARALDAQHAAHGVVWHLDCHSMKSRGNAMNVDAGAGRPDVVVSDRGGTTADPAHTAWLADWFRARGLRVLVNDPYQGGDLVRSFGAPDRGRHSIQVELNRALYMDESRIERSPDFAALRWTLDALLRDLTAHATI